MRTIYESEIEQIMLQILHDENGYTVLFGPDMLEGPSMERTPGEVILSARLQRAIERLNPHIPSEAREDVLKKALRMPAQTLMENNEAFHHLLTEGVDVKFGTGDGKTRTDKAWLLDYAHPENNEFHLSIVNLPLYLIKTLPF